jgi:peptide/nickel transport system permease protein
MSVPGQPAAAGASEIGTTSPAAVGAHAGNARIATKERLALLRRSKSFIAGSIIVGFWVLCAIFGELLVKDPLASDPINDLLAPSADHWFGTDKLGRDVFARVISGAREVLIVAPLATILATILGTALGLVTGYFRGAPDDILSRIIEAFLALPVIIMGLLVTVAVGGGSKTSLILIIGVLFAPVISRTVRAAVLTERELEYVSAARLRNERTSYVLFGEILPNVTAPIVVEFTVRLGYAIFVAAGLSFLGFGIQPPTPDWGVQVAEHYGVISGGFWWPVLFPALAIGSLVIGVNLIADGVAAVFER